MTREIKFRAWDKEDKLWVAGWSIGQMGIQSDDGRIIFMQFTGLKDKNGVEIYEGDLVKNNGYIWEVTWKDGAVYIENKTDRGVWWIGGESKHCEVIGSVYENPELIK